jgi:hypothetical protein
VAAISYPELTALQILHSPAIQRWFGSCELSDWSGRAILIVSVEWIPDVRDPVRQASPLIARSHT